MMQEKSKVRFMAPVTLGLCVGFAVAQTPARAATSGAVVRAGINSNVGLSEAESTTHGPAGTTLNVPAQFPQIERLGSSQGADIQPAAFIRGGCSDTDPPGKRLAYYMPRLPDAKGRRSWVYMICGNEYRGWRHIRDGLHFGGKWSKQVDTFINIALTDSDSQTIDQYNDFSGHTYRAYRVGIANSLTRQDLGMIRVVVDIESNVIVTAFFEDNRSDNIVW
jgi:hypothetical protein